MVTRIVLVSLLWLVTHSCIADVGSEVAKNTQAAMERGQAALEPDFLTNLTNHAQQAQSQIYDSPDSTVSTAHQSLHNLGDGPIHYTILVSESMGEDNLKSLFRSLAHRKDVSCAIRGLLPEEKTINQVGMRIISLIKDFKDVPNVVLDPRPFQAVNAELVPQILAYQGDELVASATGLSNPNYMEQQLAQGKTGYLGNFGTSYTISERDITQVLKERMANLDTAKLKKDATANYWNNVSFYGLPKARQTQTREFYPILTVGEDIVTPDNTIIAYAGQQYNSLEHLPFTQRLVIFDATDEAQLDYVKHLPSSPLRTKYITTRFDRTLKWDAVKHVENELDAPVYQLNADIIQAFDLEVVPSVVTADNARHVFLIEEIELTTERGQ